MRINQNITGFNAYRNLSANQSNLSKSLEKLSSGLRINRAADDAAGLAISEGLRADIGGLKQGTKNAYDGVSVLQTADGALATTHSLLHRMRELWVQAGNGAMSNESVDALQNEVNQLLSEVDRVASSTSFNLISLLDGTYQDKAFQVAGTAADTVFVDIGSRVVPPQDAVAAGAAWHDLSLPTAGEKMTFEIKNDKGEVIKSASHGVGSPAPATLSELVDQLNANPAFADVFEASFGPHYFADGTVKLDAHLIVMAKDPGAGKLGSSTLSVPTDTIVGQDAVREKRDGGFSCSDLGIAGFDVRKRYGDKVEPRPDNGGGGAATPPSGGGSTPPPSGGGGTPASGGRPGVRGFGFSYDPRPAPPAPPPAPSPGPAPVPSPSPAPASLPWVVTHEPHPLDEAIKLVSKARGEIGAQQNRFEHIINANGVALENLGLSESRIRDTDMAEETIRLTRSRILADAAQAMLAQANQAPQNTLQLLR